MNQKQQKTAGIAALSIVAVLGVGIVTSHFMTNKSSNTPTKTSPYSHFRGRGGPGGFFSNPGTFAGGIVTAIHGTTITVSSFRGTTSNIVTTNSTTFPMGQLHLHSRPSNLVASSSLVAPPRTVSLLPHQSL